MRTTRTSLRILTNASTVRGFITALNESLTECWLLNPLGSVPIELVHRDIYTFTYTGDRRGHVTLGLGVEPDGSLVDATFHAGFGLDEEISEGDQSVFWNQFCAQAKPVGDALGIEVELSHLPVDVDEILDSPEVDLLKRIVTFAQSGGYLHGNEDWIRFVAETHRKKMPLSHDDLRDWFVGKGWEHSVADTLADEYYFGRALLKCHEES